MRRLFCLAIFACYSTLYAQTTLPTFWTFINPSPSDDSTVAPVGWKTKLNISVSGSTPYVYSTGSDGSAACRLDATGEFVSIAFAEKPGALTYYIKGTAISGPPFAGTFTVQQSADGSTWTDLRSFTSMSGTFTKFTEAPASASRYIRFYYVDKQSGSNVALDSVYLAKPGPAATATIGVFQGNNAMANGVTYINGTTASTVFKIRNTGTSQALAISSITITGANASDYSVTNAPTSIAALDSSTFTLNFNPGASGSRFAKLTINSNDADNPAFSIDLYGISGTLATQPSAQPTAMTFNNLKAFTFNVNFAEPSAKPENYIVLRKKDAAVTEVPVDGQTYSRGDYIGGAQVAYIGSGNNFKPVNIVAGGTYHFAVFAMNGPAGYENYLTTSPLTGNVTTLGGNAGTYYSGIDPNSSSFVTSLSQRINPHDTVFYSNYTPVMINGFVTRDTTGGKKVVNCVYTSHAYVYSEPFVWNGNGPGGVLTREHTFAQSWMPTNDGSPNWYQPNGKELAEYNDLHHLFPAHQTQANVVRSNNPFGEVVTLISQFGTGKLGYDANGKKVYEPRDSHKGDAARAVFYMCTAYNGIKGKNWSLGAVTAAQQGDTILKKWHQQDPPDAWEIARNEFVYSVQHNRNPFIDNPGWVDKINFNNLSYISGGTTPSLVITSPVGGEQWTRTVSNKISWTSSLIDSLLLDLMVEDTLYTTFGPSVPAAMDSVSLPAISTLPVTTKAKIRLRERGGVLVSTSPAYFTITAGSSAPTIKDGAASVVVYPNPSQGSVTLSHTQTFKEVIDVEVSDLSGRVVAKVKMTDTIHLSFANKGMYIIKLSGAESVSYRKLLVE